MMDNHKLRFKQLITPKLTQISWLFLMMIVFLSSMDPVSAQNKGSDSECPVPTEKGDSMKIWRASARFTLTDSIFDKLSLPEAAKVLKIALEARGYTELAYISDASTREAGRSVLILTRAERIDEQGHPLPENQRWGDEIIIPEIQSVGDYISRLLYGKPKGRYRMFLFAARAHQLDVAQMHMPNDTGRMLSEHLECIFVQASRYPPLDLGDHTFEVHAHGVVYEFEKGQTDKEMILVENSALSGTQHLEAAGLLNALTEAGDDEFND